MSDAKQETTVPEKPAQMSDTDRLTLLLQTEKLGRLQAQAQLLEAQLNLVQGQLAAASHEHEAVKTTLKTRYQLEDKDSINAATGVITRFVPPAVEAAK